MGRSVGDILIAACISHCDRHKEIITCKPNPHSLYLLSTSLDSTLLLTLHLHLHLTLTSNFSNQTMATETQTVPPQPAPTQGVPQLTVLTRVASIPLISDSLQTLHSTLQNNTFTKTPYSTAQALSSYAFHFTEPIQVRLAPVIQRADGLANKAVDVVESRYPYPFHTPSQEIYGHLKAHSEHAYGVANKTIDDKVRTPVWSYNCC